MPRDLLEQAQAAAAEGEWAESHDLFARADEAGEVGAAELPMMAEVAYAAGNLDRTIEIWERAHTLAIRGGDPIAAAGAAVRVAMHLLFDTALMAPVRGWLARAERLLGDAEPTPVHVWLAVVRCYERILSGRVSDAESHAVHAIELGARFEDAAAAAAIGRVARARCLILTGRVADGLAALNEAGVAAVSGELDPLSTGVVYCELVCALQGLSQFDLAEEWTRAMESWAQTSAIGSLPGRCRVHRAEILRLRGDCHRAEDETLRACEELRPYLRRELGWPLTELGRIRLTLGAIDAAESAFLEAHEAGWDARHGLALVQLARGDVEGAAESIRSALDQPSVVPSKELPPHTDLRRAPLLSAATRIEVAAGDVARARVAAEELGAIARRFPSKALAASAAEALGRVFHAERCPAEARAQLEAAIALWEEIGAPYEAACARLALAEALRVDGDESRAALEESAARAILDRVRMGTGPHATNVETPVAIAGRARAASLRREGEWWHVVYDGGEARLSDRKGLEHLARLLAAPDCPRHVLELVAGEGSESLSPPAGIAGAELGDAGELLDDQARQSYRRRLVEIEADLDDATECADLGRIQQAQAERAFLERELSRAVGRGGRGRRAGVTSERARVSVTRAIRRAIEQIRPSLPALADHLERTVTTGTYCSYRPDPRSAVDWQIGLES